MSENRLKRELTFIQMIAIASGAVIGGWLAEAPYWFSVTGAGGALVFPLLAVLLIPVGLAFQSLQLCYLLLHLLLFGQQMLLVILQDGLLNG